MERLVEQSATAAELVIDIFTFVDAIFDPVAGAVIVAAIHPVFPTIHAIFCAIDATRRAGSEYGGGNSKEQEGCLLHSGSFAGLFVIPLMDKW